jgi:hypothetical protein
MSSRLVSGVSLLRASLATLAVAAVSIASPAQAQVASGVTVAVSMKDTLQRLDANGNNVTKRVDPASREGVNLSDCHADQSIVFPIVESGFAPGDVSEIWASNGAVDCTSADNRPGVQSVHCYKLGTFPLTTTTSTTIKVKALLGATGATTFDAQGCPSIDISTITIYFMIFRGGVATAPVGSDTVPIKVDTQGPLGLTGVKALPGNGAITISWDSVGEAGAQDIIGAEALCDPAPTPSTATEAGTNTVCVEGGTTTDVDAGDGEASTSTGSEPSCSSVPAEGGAAGGPIPTPSEIPSDGLACTTQAFANSTAVPCGSVSGTTGNTIRIDNINGQPLQNGVVYAVAVGGTDSFQNVGSVSSAVCQFPEATSDFWQDYRTAGGQSGGCAIEGDALPIGSFTLLMVGSIMTLSILRRQRRRSAKKRNDR